MIEYFAGLRHSLFSSSNGFIRNFSIDRKVYWFIWFIETFLK